MFQLMLNHLKGFVVIMYSDLSSVDEGMEQLKAERYG